MEGSVSGAAGRREAAVSSASDYLSGKTHRDENFPVASRLIAKRYRAPILAFYRFVRTADDVADSAGLDSGEKLRLLDGLEEALTGRGPADPAAEPLRAVLAETGLTDRHALDLIAAFRRDATQARYADWADLMDYCRYSAMPVGRYVLDVHGEDEATWPASDALCAALQIINHIQDCGSDFRRLDRLYMPLDLLARHAVAPEEFAGNRASPAMRAFLDEMIGRCRELIGQSIDLEPLVRNRRLATEIAVIRALAMSQLDHLARHDPLAGEGRPPKPVWLLVAAGAALRFRLVRTSARAPSRLGEGGAR